MANINKEKLLKQLTEGGVDTCPPCCPTCPGDCAGLVGQPALDCVINNWSEDGEPCTDPCDGDYNGDGVVDVNDLLHVLDNWPQDDPMPPPPIASVLSAIKQRGKPTLSRSNESWLPNTNEWFIPNGWQDPDTGWFWKNGRWWPPRKNPDDELDPNYELPLNPRQPTHGPGPVERTESWLPNTSKSMFPDTWKKNLAKSVNEHWPDDSWGQHSHKDRTTHLPLPKKEKFEYETIADWWWNKVWDQENLIDNLPGFPTFGNVPVKAESTQRPTDAQLTETAPGAHPPFKYPPVGDNM